LVFANSSRHYRYRNWHFLFDVSPALSQIRARVISRTPGAIAAGQNAEAVMVDLMQPAQASFHQNLVEIHQELVETRLNASVRSN
jgi:hypothetical protein